MSNWKAGDKALRIAHSLQSRGIAPNGRPVKGTIYLVEGVTHYWGGEKVGLIIAGLPALDENIGIEVGWDQRFFRKLVPACDRNEREQTELHPHAGYWEGQP